MDNNPLLRNRKAYEEEKATGKTEKELLKKDLSTLGGCFGMLGCGVVALTVGLIALIWLLKLLNGA